MSKYIVRDVVCDWGICSVDDLGKEELVEVCNSKANAELICEILNADLIKDGKYTIWKDKKISDLEAKLKALQNGIIDDETLCSLVREHKLYKELEAKLVESEKSKEINIKERDKICLEMATDYNRQILELKQQLTIQENTITNLIEDNRASQEWYKKQLAEKEEELNYIVMKYNHAQGLLCDVTRNNQDKISFAVERLEQVLVLIHNAVNIDSPEYDLVGLYDAVNNQIKQLKEGQ